MGKFTQTTFACLFLLFIVHVDGFSKYGRTCQDIGCLSNEECIIVHECDPQNRDKCNYPKCERKRNFKPTCATTFCGGSQDCIINPIDGKPRCVDDPSRTVPRPGGHRPAPPRPIPSYDYSRYRPSSNNRGNNRPSYPIPNDINDRYRSGHRDRPTPPRRAGGGNYKTHESTDRNGNRQWTFSG